MNLVHDTQYSCFGRVKVKKRSVYDFLHFFTADRVVLKIHFSRIKNLAQTAQIAFQCDTIVEWYQQQQPFD